MSRKVTLNAGIFSRTLIYAIIAAGLFFTWSFYQHVFALQTRQSVSLPNVIPREQLKTGIELIIKGDYKGGLHYAEFGMTGDELAKQFLKASILYARMGELETKENSGEFFLVTDWIVEESRKRIALNSDDVTARFFLGNSLCYRAVVFSNEGRLWAAWRNGVNGKKELEKCVEIIPDFPEPHLGIGSYQYWMSARNFLRFLPGIPDEREKGIREIKKNLNPESISYALSLNQLIWILLDYKEYHEAEKIVKDGLRLYPASRFFLYPAAITAQKLGNWQEAASFFNQAKESLEKDGLRDRYMWVKVAVKQAEVLFAAGEYDRAQRLCTEILASSIIPLERDKSNILFKKARAIEKMCSDKLKK